MGFFKSTRTLTGIVIQLQPSEFMESGLNDLDMTIVIIHIEWFFQAKTVTMLAMGQNSFSVGWKQKVKTRSIICSKKKYISCTDKTASILCKTRAFLRVVGYYGKNDPTVHRDSYFYAPFNKA